jgi:hypothetical protein
MLEGVYWEAEMKRILRLLMVWSILSGLAVVALWMWLGLDEQVITESTSFWVIRGLFRLFCLVWKPVSIAVAYLLLGLAFLPGGSAVHMLATICVSYMVIFVGTGLLSASIWAWWGRHCEQMLKKSPEDAARVVRQSAILRMTLIVFGVLLVGAVSGEVAAYLLR